MKALIPSGFTTALIDGIRGTSALTPPRSPVSNYDEFSCALTCSPSQPSSFFSRGLASARPHLLKIIPGACKDETGLIQAIASSRSIGNAQRPQVLPPIKLTLPIEYRERKGSPLLDEQKRLGRISVIVAEDERRFGTAVGILRHGPA
jgi:hypothetical protein